MTIAKSVYRFARNVFRNFEFTVPQTSSNNVLCEETIIFGPEREITVYVRARTSHTCGNQILFVTSEIELKDMLSSVCLAMPMCSWTNGERPWHAFKYYTNFSVQIIEAGLHVLTGVPPIISIEPLSAPPTLFRDGSKMHTYPNGAVIIQPIVFEFRATAKRTVLTSSNLCVFTEPHPGSVRGNWSIVDRMSWSRDKNHMYGVEKDFTPAFIECTTHIKNIHGIIAEKALSKMFETHSSENLPIV